jgi:hypothetical protein
MGKQIMALLMLLGLSVSVSAAALDGVMLTYMVNEAGLEPHPSRIIVTKTIMRMDDGAPGGDYLLFDREKKLISSVTHEDGTVLEIPMRAVTQASPIALKRDHSLEPNIDAPMISGKPTHQLRLFVNDRLCYDAVVVPGLLEDVVKALRDFNLVLAGEQGKMLGELPSDMIDGCDLALHTFYPQWTLESGLAIQEWDASLQQRRLLVDIDQAFKAEPKLFELPADYQHYSIP